MKPNETPTPTPTPSAEHESGDANLDNRIDLSDALIVLKAALGIQQLSDEQQAVCDMNNDDIIDLKDALLILKKALSISA